MLGKFDPDDVPVIREALEDTAKEAMRAGEIVRRLRNFVARGEVEKTIEDLPALINEAAMLGLMDAREKNVETHFDLDPLASPVRSEDRRAVNKSVRTESLRGSAHPDKKNNTRT